MLRAWLVDDEALAVLRLTRMLETSGRVEVAGSSTDPEDALEQLRHVRVDALFLDIEMPGIDGFGLLGRLESHPLVVFTTAYDQYAVRAFEVNGIDYLLKPVNEEALGRAVTRLEERVRAADPVSYQELVGRLTATLRQRPRRIASRLGDRVQFLDLDKITHFFADGKLTYAATGGKTYVVDESIVQLEARLDQAQFHRIHRSCMVNLSAVAEVCTWFGGKMIARLNDEAHTELPVARDRARSLKERLVD